MSFVALDYFVRLTLVVWLISCGPPVTSAPHLLNNLLKALYSLLCRAVFTPLITTVTSPGYRVQ